MASWATLRLQSSQAAAVFVCGVCIGLVAYTLVTSLRPLERAPAPLHRADEAEGSASGAGDAVLDVLDHRPGPVVIGVAGASGSGKTSLGRLVAARLREMHVDAEVTDLSCDSYYKSLPPGADASKHNFDHPGALDFDLLVEHLARLKGGHVVAVPRYSFTHHSREKETVSVDGGRTDVIILDGIFVLGDPRVRRLLDISVFCSEEPDICLVRRLRRDLVERGRSVDSVLTQYLRFVRPGFQSFVSPTMQHADLIIPRAKENATAISVLARECARKVIARLREQAAGGGSRTDGPEAEGEGGVDLSAGPITPRAGSRGEADGLGSATPAMFSYTTR